MSRAACAKVIINARLMGKIEQWKEVEGGLVAVISSPDFMNLSGSEQAKLLAPVMKADRDAIESLGRLVDSYDDAAAEILTALVE